jgi:hypothetical protein
MSYYPLGVEYVKQVTLKQVVFVVKVGNTYAVYAGCCAADKYVKLTRQVL